MMGLALRLPAVLCLALLLSALPLRAQDAKKPLPAVDAYNFVVGTQTIGAAYQFTKEPRLVETARAILNMGSNTIKFSLAADKNASPKPQSLTDIVQRDLAVKTVLAMPFAHYILWAYPLSTESSRFKPSSLRHERQEMYDLTRHLLQTYDGTGKTFYLGNWEGDWHLTHLNPNYSSTSEEVQNFAAWINARQQAIDDAKRDTPHKNVQVYCYLEVNRVVDAMQGKTRLANAVLPKTNVDFVSYSSYDSLGGDIGANLTKALNYIEAQMPPKPGLTGKRVWIGEYGFPADANSPQEQDDRTRQVMRAGLAWGCPFVLYWELYNNEVTSNGKQRGFWLIDDHNVKQPAYFTHQRFYAQARRYVTAFQKEHGRLPTRSEFGQAALPWLDTGQMRPAFAKTSSPLYTFDLTPTSRYDLKTDRGKNNAWAEVHLVAALQGLVNRREARLFVRYVTGDAKTPGGIDTFWLHHLREPGGWLEHRPLQPISALESLVGTFEKDVRGVVLYDLRVPATSNVASTVAGCDDLLPVAYDPAPGSVYDRLVLHGPRLPVKVRLLHEDGSPLFTGAETGSAKCDAYLWAKRRYLDTGKCDPTKLAYYIDSWWLTAPAKAAPECHSLSNHDYFVARRAFFFDLSPWEDELPQDDKNQPLGTDERTLCAILRAANARTQGRHMINVSGFIPWAWKYTQTAGGKHGDVATEWHYAAILSCFNAYMDADALGLNAMANASVFALFPLKPRYPQPKPTEADWAKMGFLDSAGQVAPRTYVAFYSGDYDSSAWLYQRLPRLWTDPARGTIPLGWAFNPNLADRFPVGLDWARRTATPQDYFISGDSGAGYLNPGLLDGDRPYSRLPSGLAAWEEHCRKYYRQWDISLTGFVIDGDAPPMSEAVRAAYARFSPDGIVAQKLPAYDGLVSGTRTPFLTMGSDMPNGDQTGEALSRIEAALAGDQGPGPHFHIFRTILWSPTQHAQLFARLQTLPQVTVVDPYTLLGLLRRSLQTPKR